jgi:hypothetical protein
MPTATQRGYDPANYYVWHAPGGFSVHLGLHVVRELAVQAAASGETCGILLGRSITTPSDATMADDFVVIPPLDDFESARRAAENDGRQLRAIGYFRSQRDGPLSLNARDLLTFERWFYENGSVGLLIRAPRRGDSEAALFYWEGGQPHPHEFGFGFPFDARKLAGGHPGWRFPNPIEPKQEAPPQSAFRRAAGTPVVAPSESIRWSRLWPTMAITAVAALAAQVTWNSRGTKSAQTSPASETSTESAYQMPLGLKVTSRPGQLGIRWNGAAPTVAAAIRGTLDISEANATQAIALDVRGLQQGYFTYTPKTSNVSIRFEVTAADGSAIAESIRAVATP